MGIAAPLSLMPVAIAVADWPTWIDAAESDTEIVVKAGGWGIGATGVAAPAALFEVPPPHPVISNTASAKAAMHDLHTARSASCKWISTVTNRILAKV